CVLERSWYSLLEGAHRRRTRSSKEIELPPEMASDLDRLAPSSEGLLCRRTHPDGWSRPGQSRDQMTCASSLWD
ncbi:MAG TPA: hypothetical protein VEI52_19765, partial [Terriglobales bacterium]|nr:hypothetical protein [Terriglobales bacterium]